MAELADDAAATAAQTGGEQASETAAAQSPEQETTAAAVDKSEATPAQDVADTEGAMTSLLESADDVQAEGAPEAYEDFEGENGQKFTPDQVRGFSEAAKELGLSQEKAQKLFAVMAPTARGYLQKNLVEQSNAWAKQSQSDPEFGGDQFKQNSAVIREAYNAYTTPELRAIINGSGLGNHPEVLRMFYRIGKSMQQDHGVTGSASAPSPRRSRYPKSNMVADL